MKKHVTVLRASAAALAASAALALASAANAQSPEAELDGAPRLFGSQAHDRYDGRDGSRDHRGRDWDDRRRAPDFQRAQRECSRAAVREAWGRNYYSAQYEGGPRLDYGRNGWEMVGRMRLHDRRGYSYVNTVCELRGDGAVADFDFLR